MEEPEPARPPPPPQGPGGEAHVEDEEEDEEEHECRVCRETHGPLFRPCKCSGSIMYTHEDCLLQWLTHSGKDSCELCKHRFVFRPVYADDAPRVIPARQVAARCLRKAALEYLPFLARLALAGALWLGLVPLTTSWVYRIWIRRASFLVPNLVRRRPVASAAAAAAAAAANATVAAVGGGNGTVAGGGEQQQPQPLGASMLWDDIVSGIIITAFIIFSFLSLMSFADFLRFHWDVREDNDAVVGGGAGAVHNDNLNIPRAAAAPLGDVAGAGAGPLEAAAAAAAPGHEEAGHEQQLLDEEEEQPPADDDWEDDDALVPAAEEAAAAAVMAFGLPDEDDDDEEEEDEDDEEEEEDEDVAVGQHVVPPPPLPRQQAPQQQPPPPPMPAAGVGAVVDDGDMDVELHVAVDELLGIRGPFPFLVRNCAWLALFNGAYLGLFAFIPYSVGAAVVGAAERYVDSPLLRFLRVAVPAPVCELAVEVSRAAAQEDHTLQLPDTGVILLGYAVMAAMVFTWRAIACAVCQRVAGLPMLGKVAQVLECTAAVVKVGLLLALKMIFIPLALGLWLDAATAPVLGPPHLERVRFATENLVGALLLHWVCGITFMLVVTVSVLQLREVLHPDILARVIRPQEPQPDLLGSLLQEPGLTHARRMAISLGIYVVLLFLFVWLPARLLGLAAETAAAAAATTAGSTDASSAWAWLLQAARGLGGPFALRTAYLAPQLQIPAELVLFHLAMLAFLEHSKGAIGRLQHLWLKPLCASLGLTRFLLPVPRLRGGGGERAPGADRGHGQEVDEDGCPLGPPLERPPVAGWEDGGPEHGRWAWGNEQPSAVEASVAPRAVPCLWWARLALLLVAAWASILLLVLAAGLLPLLLGRGAFRLLHVPPRFTHDPFAFAVGVGFCWGAHRWVLRVQQYVAPATLRAWRGRATRPTLRQAGAVALAFFLWFGLAPLLLGLLFELLLVVRAEAWAESGWRGLHLAQDWLLGHWFLQEGAYLSYIGVIDRVWGQGQRQGQGQGQGQGRWDGGRRRHRSFQGRFTDTLTALYALVIRWNWRRATWRDLAAPFVWPVTQGLLEAVLVPAAAAALYPRLAARFPDFLLLLLPEEGASTPSSSFLGAAAAALVSGKPPAAMQLVAFRAMVLAWWAAHASLRLAAPVERWLEAARAAVRDEKYLVRNELVNYDAPPPAAAEEAARTGGGGYESD